MVWLEAMAQFRHATALYFSARRSHDRPRPATSHHPDEVVSFKRRPRDDSIGSRGQGVGLGLALGAKPPNLDARSTALLATQSSATLCCSGFQDLGFRVQGIRVWLDQMLNVP